MSQAAKSPTKAGEALKSEQGKEHTGQSSQQSSQQSKRDALVIIAPEGYQKTELEGTLKGLRDKGFGICIASKEKGTCKSDSGDTKEAQEAIRDVKENLFDRIVVVGGKGAETLENDNEALELVRRFDKAGKIVGGICHGAAVLACAGVLQNKRATTYQGDPESSSGEKKTVSTLKQHGVQFVPDQIVIDGRFITAEGPDAAEKFGLKFAECEIAS